MTDLIPVFDGHNDVLLRLYQSGVANPEERFLEGWPGGHLDLPRARKGGFAGGMFAIFPPPTGKRVPDEDAPPPLAREIALSATLAMASILLRLERLSAGALVVCRSAGEIRSAMESGALAAVFHIEGVEAIDTELMLLDVLYTAVQTLPLRCQAQA